MFPNRRPYGGTDVIAINTIRTEPHYRHLAFNTGLEKLGYTLRVGGRPKAKEDLLLLWNLHGPNETRGRDWEAQGGTVIVCENGYIGKDAGGLQLYAISVHGHNGSGWFPVGTDDRFAALGIALQPWRAADGHILVCGQRGIGSRKMASPPNWEDGIVKQLATMGMRNVKVRRHPGQKPAATTLEQDLDGAALCMVWSSASGVKAMTLGVPVVYCAPHWICEAAASRGIESVAEPVRSDELRNIAMHHMSHGQWSVAEIETGEPFARILANLGSAKW